ncbi:MAG TPA: hypothetical protein VMV94_19870 [Phycisphaerae bacterium]|nr:hypothetical protein [Phycisphaerae bacterium]
MRFAIMTSAIALTICGLLSVSVYAQPAAAGPAAPPKAAPAQPVETPASFPWEGEVTGTNVYIRSGAGVNWYATTKLNTGDRVLVLSEKFGWYQISPPKGSFSYIDKSMVERQPADAKTGTVKGDKVYVRAGSELEDRKSATQTMLDKGAKVEIIGEAEGFYKIQPPKGASLYVSKTYVEPVAARLRTGLMEQYAATAGPAPKTEPSPGATAKPEIGTAPTPAAGTPGTTTPPGDGTVAGAAGPAPEDVGPPLDVEPGVEPSPQKATKPTTPGKPGADRGPAAAGAAPGTKDRAAAKLPPSNRPRYEVMLTELENLMHAELRRPVKEQDLGPLLARFEEVANQKEENIPAQVAKIRVQQLKDWQALVAARGDSAGTAADLASFRAQLNEERMKIMAQRYEKAAKKYDLEGELRRSYAFAAQQRRYRLVDPHSGMTIAYVDVPPTLNVNVENLVGCVVGIVASEKQFSPAARVPIAVAKDVVDLSSRNLPGGAGNPEQPANPENSGAGSNKSIPEVTGAPAAPPASDKPLAAGNDQEAPG